MSVRVRTALPLPRPLVAPVLDPGFRPVSLARRAFRDAVAASKRRLPIRIALERGDGLVSVHEDAIDGDPDRLEQSLAYVERLLKALLWIRGGHTVWIAGCEALAERLRAIYAPGGEREFDYRFFGEQVYERPLEIRAVRYEQAPEEREAAAPLGRHLEGCRIGLDLGGSDRKVSAVVDGEPVFSEEVVWHPKTSADPEYHVREIRSALLRAAAHLPRVDAIGVSAAGIYVDNRAMVASLFRQIPRGAFDARIRDLFLELAQEWGVPVEVANDGDVTALAGAMSLETDAVLGIAMGTSEAAGYVGRGGGISGWLNELAFVPVDAAPQAPVDDEWSGDRGTGVLYFSQEAVARYASAAGIAPAGEDQAERLASVQQLLARGDERARRVFETIGACFGYALAHYADFYDVSQVLVLGRVTSGSGGDLICAQARRVLETEFPQLATAISLRLPDERSKRVGQAIAAASLPSLAS